MKRILMEAKSGAHNLSWQWCFIAWLITGTRIAHELHKNAVKHFNERICSLNGGSAQRLPLYRRKKFTVIFPANLPMLKYDLDIDMLMIDVHHIYV